MLNRITSAIRGRNQNASSPPAIQASPGPGSVQDSALDIMMQQAQQQYQAPTIPWQRGNRYNDGDGDLLKHAVATKAAELPASTRHILLDRLQGEAEFACLFAYTAGASATASAAAAARTVAGPSHMKKLDALVNGIKAEHVLACVKEEEEGGEHGSPNKKTKRSTKGPAPDSAAAAAGGAAGAAASSSAALSEPGASTAPAAPCLDLKVVPEFTMYAAEPEAATAASSSSGAATKAVRAVVSLKAAAQQQSQRSSVALTFVLDKSGSMSGPRIELLKETSHFLISQVTGDDHLSFVCYSSSATLDVPLVRMTPAAKAFAHTIIESLFANGSTALYDGTIKGMEQMVDSLENDAGIARAVLLCTDGEATDGPTTSDDILPRLHNKQQQLGRPITIHTFGIGEGHSAQLLEAIAEGMSGSYYYIKKADEIPEAYGDALGGLVSVVASGVRVQIRARPGVALQGVETGGTMVRSADATSITFNDLYAEEARDLLLTLNVPPSLLAATAASVDVADVVVTYMDTGAAAARELRGVVSVSVGAEGSQEADPLVLTTAARYDAVSAIKRAEELDEAGKHADAAAVLSAVGARLKSTAEITKSSPRTPPALQAQLEMFQAQTAVVARSIAGGNKGSESKAVQKAAAWGLSKQRAARAGATSMLPSNVMYDNATRVQTRTEAYTSVQTSMASKGMPRPPNRPSAP